MSGYLTRLAERAMNRTPPTVHANARLPFFEAPEALGEVETTMVETGMGRLPVSADNRPAQAIAKRESPLVVAPSVGRAPRPLAAPSMSVETVHRSLLMPSEESAELPRPAVDRDATHPIESAPHLRNETKRIDASETRQEVANRPAVTAIARAAAALPRIAAVPPPSARSAVAPVSTPTGESQAPDVHIHIGRIELTAVSEAATPTRPAKSAKKPMSLDEYLGRTRGGSA